MRRFGASLLPTSDVPGPSSLLNCRNIAITLIDEQSKRVMAGLGVNCPGSSGILASLLWIISDLPVVRPKHGSVNMCSPLETLAGGSLCVRA